MGKVPMAVTIYKMAIDHILGIWLAKLGTSGTLFILHCKSNSKKFEKIQNSLKWVKLASNVKNKTTFTYKTFLVQTIKVVSVFCFGAIFTIF